MYYRSLLVIAVIVGCLSGCKTPPHFDAVYSRVTTATLHSGQPIPSLQGKPIVTITGKIKASQARSGAGTKPPDRIEMDRASLTAVGLVEYATPDFFEKKVNRFRGVLMRDLLALWQVSPEATKVTLTALNDYKITIPIALLQQYPVLLAMEQEGAVMQPDYRGPAMIVTPYEQYPAVTALANRDYWIWQVTKIQIE